MQISYLSGILLILWLGPLAAQPVEPVEPAASTDEIAAMEQERPSPQVANQGNGVEGEGETDDSRPGQNAQGFDLFIPSESIAEDFAVPFPVDI